jgi:hypothetical protein
MRRIFDPYFPWDKKRHCPVYPCTRNLGGTFNELLSQYTLHYRFKGKHCILVFPTGFVWDGASVPRFAWSLIGVRPEGVMLLPSLIHDVLYRSEGLRNGHGQSEISETIAVGKTIFNKDESDHFLVDLMAWTGEYNSIKMRLVYGIVRTFGNKYWAGDAPNFNNRRG